MNKLMKWMAPKRLGPSTPYLLHYSAQEETLQQNSKYRPVLSCFVFVLFLVCFWFVCFYLAHTLGSQCPYLDFWKLDSGCFLIFDSSKQAHRHCLHNTLSPSYSSTAPTPLCLTICQNNETSSLSICVVQRDIFQNQGT